MPPSGPLMERRFYRELWRSRFEKMLKLEIQSVSDYSTLLEECNRRYKNHTIIPHLERLIADEKRHAVLVRELLQILERQPESK